MQSTNNYLNEMTVLQCEQGIIKKGDTVYFESFSTAGECTCLGEAKVYKINPYMDYDRIPPKPYFHIELDLSDIDGDFVEVMVGVSTYPNDFAIFLRRENAKLPRNE